MQEIMEFFRFRNSKISTIFAKFGTLIKSAESNQISQKNYGVTGHIRKIEAKEE
jgi:hypothetical protein